MNRVRIFDTTLRDGEQSPGCTMTMEEKLKMLNALIDLRVDVIEAGFPASSQGDLESVRAIAQHCRSKSSPVVCALARLEKADIDAAITAITPARHKRIHVFIATSLVQMNAKFNDGSMEESELRELVLKKIENLVSYAKIRAEEIGAEVEFSAEDATRSDPVYLLKCFQAAINAGAKILNVPDTVGYTTPQEYHNLISFLIKNLRTAFNEDMKEAVENGKYVFSAHCHDDLGLAVANSLAAIQAGARQVECTVGGIGERCGNAKLEALTMALTARKDYYNLRHGINTKSLTGAVKILEEMTEFKREITHPIVGKNAFAHEAGIHSAAVIKDPATYEHMNPEDVGQVRNIILGKHAGRNSFRFRITELGLYPLIGENDIAREDVVVKVVKECKSWADENKFVPDSLLVRTVVKIAFGHTLPEEIHDLHELLSLTFSLIDHWHPPLVFQSYHVEQQDKERFTIRVNLMVGGLSREVSISENGLINSLFLACKQASGMSRITLEDFNVSQVEHKGSASMGRAWCKVSHAESCVEAEAFDEEINQASAKAFINAFNKLLLVLHINDLRGLAA